MLYDRVDAKTMPERLMKTLAFIHRNDTHAAVGDFSPVVSVFSHYELGNTVSPFLLLDHIGPGHLRPSQRQQGVTEHPHRGFETVTLVYQGELEHRDSSGGGGLISAGDVQWMTAGRGVIHREVFSPAFTAQGGAFEMLQLWVNLPARDKMNPARYQHLSHTKIPVVVLSNGFVRVIAGEYAGVQGIAQTHTRLQVLDIQLAQGESVTISMQHLDTALIYVRTGKIDVGSDELIDAQSMAVMSSHGDQVQIIAHAPSLLVVLSGEPLAEPLYGRGFFVMNTYDEVLQAYEDLKQGKLG